MSQISRPFQIALLAVAVLAAAWVFVFQQHTSTTTSSGGSAPVVSSPTPSSSATAAAEAKAAAAPSHVYDGAAPGVQGLTRAINSAHGAVAKSQQNANQLQEKSEQVSAQSTPASSTPTSTASTPAHSSSPTAVTHTKAAHPSTPLTASAVKAHKVTSAPHTSKASAGTPAGQRSVEAELARGNVVVVLFWNPKASDDVAVRGELQLLLNVHRKFAAYKNNPKVTRLSKAFGFELEKKIAVNEATPSQAASFGSITRNIQIFGTPTLLVIDKQGKTIVLTGLQDAFSVEQAIVEARHA